MLLRCRSAVPADAPAIARLLVLAWQKTYRGILADALLNGLRAEELTGRIQHGIKTRPDFRNRVLETDGAIAGGSVCCPCPDGDLADAMEIQGFHIHPDDQRQGFGRALMEYTTALRSLAPAPIAL